MFHMEGAKYEGYSHPLFGRWLSNIACGVVGHSVVGESSLTAVRTAPTSEQNLVR